MNSFLHGHIGSVRIANLKEKIIEFWNNNKFFFFEIIIKMFYLYNIKII